MESPVVPPPSDPLIRSVRRTIAERRLIRRGQHILVACSGGADSTALLVILCVLGRVDGFSLSVGHVNHRLRGEESEADERWVAQLAEGFGVPFRRETVEVRRLRARRGGSVEEVARWARHEALRSMARSEDAELIAIGHHLDDQAETVLMHVLRGSGLAGIAGMVWGPEGGVIRPLLGTRRSEIRAALSRWDIPWREDSSNLSLEMTRNRLRHVLIPALEAEWNPGVIPALSRLAELASAEKMALDVWVDRIWHTLARTHPGERVILDGSVARSYPLGIRRRIVRRAAESLTTVTAPLSYAETDRLVALVERRGEVVLRGRLNAWSTRDMVVVESAHAWRGPTPVDTAGSTRLPGWGTLTLAQQQHPGESRQPRASHPGTCMFSWKKGAVGSQVSFRRWRKGDRIRAREGKLRLVADLARKRRPPLDPRLLVVVEEAGQIIWVPGLASAESLGASPECSTVLLRWDWENDAPIT